MQYKGYVTNGSVKSDKQEILDKTASAADIAQPNSTLYIVNSK